MGVQWRKGARTLPATSAEVGYDAGTIAISRAWMRDMRYEVPPRGCMGYDGSARIYITGRCVNKTIQESRGDAMYSEKGCESDDSRGERCERWRGEMDANGM